MLFPIVSSVIILPFRWGNMVDGLEHSSCFSNPIGELATQDVSLDVISRKLGCKTLRELSMF